MIEFENDVHFFFIIVVHSWLLLFTNQNFPI